MKLQNYLQPPNTPLYVTLIFALLAILTPDEMYIEAVFSAIAYGALFAWSWMEIVNGANTFRRLLGIAVFAVLVAGVSMRFAG